MTKFAEVVYEDGSHSLVSYDSDGELRNLLTENHRRATSGESSAPQDISLRIDLDPNDPVFGNRGPEGAAALSKNRPAFRVKRVFLYDKHPADLVPVGNEGTMPVKASAVKELLDGMAGDGDEVNMHQLTQALRDEASPVFTNAQGKYESHYKMPDTGEFDLSFLEGNNAPEQGRGR